jgi:hypothetical protein
VSSPLARGPSPLLPPRQHPRVYLGLSMGCTPKTRAVALEHQAMLTCREARGVALEALLLILCSLHLAPRGLIRVPWTLRGIVLDCSTTTLKGRPCSGSRRAWGLCWCPVKSGGDLRLRSVHPCAFACSTTGNRDDPSSRGGAVARTTTDSAITAAVPRSVRTAITPTSLSAPMRWL